MSLTWTPKARCYCSWHHLQPLLGPLCCVSDCLLVLAPSQVSLMPLPDLSLSHLPQRPLLIFRLRTLRKTPTSSRAFSPLNLPESQPFLPTSSHTLLLRPTAAQRKVALLFRANSSSSICAIDDVLKLSIKTPLSSPCSETKSRLRKCCYSFIIVFLGYSTMHTKHLLNKGFSFFKSGAVPQFLTIFLET